MRKNYPSAIPLLTDEQWKFIEDELSRKPTQKDIDKLKRIKEMFKDKEVIIK